MAELGIKSYIHFKLGLFGSCLSFSHLSMGLVLNKYAHPHNFCIHVYEYERERESQVMNIINFAVVGVNKIIILVKIVTTLYIKVVTGVLGYRLISNKAS